MTAPFGQRLADAVAARGPLCVGIDPHAPLLAAWGLTDDPAGLARFTDTVVDALATSVAVLKPQLAFYERHGSRGLAVLEDAVARARAAGALVLLDAKRGDIGPTTGSFGVVVGATLAALDVDLDGLGGPILAPGLGAQGGSVADLRRLFGTDRAVVPTVSRDVLAAGPH